MAIPVSPIIPGIELPETVYAKDQPEYQPLPVHRTAARHRTKRRCMNLSRVIKQWRWAEKLSLREAAERIGVDRCAVHRLEQGKSITAENLAAIVRWLLSESN